MKRKILKFEDYLKADQFIEQVKKPLLDRNPLYEMLQHGDEGIALITHSSFIYVLLRYIPRSEMTDLPSVSDSYKGVQVRERVSNGEWVVEEIHKLKRDDGLSIYPLIYAKTKRDGWFKTLKSFIVDNSIIHDVEDDPKEKKEL